MGDMKSREKAGGLRGCPLEVQITNEKGRVSRNTGTGGLANVNSDLTNFLGEGRKKAEEAEVLFCRETYSQPVAQPHLGPEKWCR